MNRVVLILFLLVVSCLPVVSVALPKEAKAKKQVRLEVSDLKGKAALPLEKRGYKANVLLFITPDCPISNTYAPEFNSIVKDYAPKRVAFSVVYVATDLSGTELAKHAKEYGYRCSTLVDRKLSLVHRMKARITPEVVVLSSAGSVAYQGRIDNLYVDFGKRRHEPTERYLRDALDSLLAGKRIAVSRTSPIGCFIPAN